MKDSYITLKYPSLCKKVQHEPENIFKYYRKIISFWLRSINWVGLHLLDLLYIKKSFPSQKQFPATNTLFINLKYQFLYTNYQKVMKLKSYNPTFYI